MISSNSDKIIHFSMIEYGFKVKMEIGKLKKAKKAIALKI